MAPSPFSPSPEKKISIFSLKKKSFFSGIESYIFKGYLTFFRQYKHTQSTAGNLKTFQTVHGRLGLKRQFQYFRQQYRQQNLAFSLQEPVQATKSCDSNYTDRFRHFFIISVSGKVSGSFHLRKHLTSSTWHSVGSGRVLRRFRKIPPETGSGRTILSFHFNSYSNII